MGLGYLTARPACYEILSEIDGEIETEIVAGADAGIIGRIVVWARSEAEAAIRLGEMRREERRPQWAGDELEQKRTKRARAQDQGRLL